MDTAFNTQSYNKNVNNLLSNTENAFSKTFGKIGKVVTKALAVTAIAGFTKSCLELGSNLEEVQNVVDVTFPKMAEQVNAFSQNAATQFGLSEKMAKQYMGTFGAMSKNFGFSEQAAYEMSKTVTGLVGDVASFYDISQDLAAIKLKSIWTGETETLKDLGIVMTQNALEEYALQQGIGKTISKMSEAERVALRYAFVQDKLALATGDFARTSNSWANQTRILSLQFEQLKATLGQGFITLFTPILKGINSILAGLQKVANVFTAVVTRIFGKQKQTVSAVADDYVSLGTSALDTANDVASASKKMQKSVMGYDKLNILSNKKDDGKSSTGSSIPNVGVGAIETPDIADNISPKVDAIADKIVSALNVVKIGFENVKNFIQQHWDTIVAIIVAGAVTISTALIGIKIAQFVSSLSDAFGKITEAGGLFSYLAGVIGGISAPILIVVGILAILAGSFTYLYMTSETFRNSINEIVSAFANALSPAIQFITDTVIPNIINGFSNFMVVMQPLIDFISGVLADAWNKILQPALMYIAETVIPKLISTFENLWNNVLVPFGNFICDILEPIIKILTEAFQILWENVLLPLADFLGGIFSKNFEGYSEILNKTVIPAVNGVISVFSWLWNNVLSPIVNFLWSNLKPAFEVVTSTIGNVLGSMKSVFGGIIDFITGIFTGNWKRAWNEVVSIFKGIINGLASIFKLPINLIISGINSFIRALNRIKIPEWVPAVGGFGFNIPQIPKLAEGGWFQARNPRLAIVGEGKSNEIVAPEPKLDEAIDRGFKRNETVGNNKLEITIIHKYPDGETMIDEINEAQVKAGKILLNV